MACCPPTVCVSRTVFVDAKYGSNTCGQIGSAVQPYRTLNAAIRACPPEWLVYVRPGRYRVSASLQDKYFYASQDVAIEITDPKFISGVIMFTGFAQLLGGLQLETASSTGNSHVEFWTIDDGDPVRPTISVDADKVGATYFYFDSATKTAGLADLIRITKDGVTVSKISVHFECRELAQKGAGWVVRSAGGARVVADEAVAAKWGVMLEFQRNIVKLGTLKAGDKAAVVGSKDPYDLMKEANTSLEIDMIEAPFGVEFHAGVHTVVLGQVGKPDAPAQMGLVWPAKSVRTTETVVDFRQIYAKEAIFVKFKDGDSISMVGGLVGSFEAPSWKALQVENQVPAGGTAIFKYKMEGFYAGAELLSHTNPGKFPGTVISTGTVDLMQRVRWIPPVSVRPPKPAVAILKDCNQCHTSMIKIVDPGVKASLVAGTIDMRQINPPDQATTIMLGGMFSLVCQDLKSAVSGFIVGSGKLTPQVTTSQVDKDLIVTIPFCSGPLGPPIDVVFSGDTATVGGSLVNNYNPHPAPGCPMSQPTPPIGPEHRVNISLKSAITEATSFSMMALAMILDVYISDLKSSGRILENITPSDIGLFTDSAVGTDADAVIRLAAPGGAKGYFSSTLGNTDLVGSVFSFVNDIDQAVTLNMVSLRTAVDAPALKYHTAPHLTTHTNGWGTSTYPRYSPDAPPPSFNPLPGAIFEGLAR